MWKNNDESKMTGNAKIHLTDILNLGDLSASIDHQSSLDLQSSLQKSENSGTAGRLAEYLDRGRSKLVGRVAVQVYTIKV